MRIEIASTNRNATEHISENNKTNPVSINEMCFYKGGGGGGGGDSLQGTIGGK